MAATAPIILSSSPSHSIISTTPPRALNAAMSSSPGLPSPSQLFKKTNSLLATGEGASPVSKGPALGFTSASSLLRQVHSQERPPSPPIVIRKELSEKRNQQSCDKPSRKRKKGAVQDDAGGTVPEKARAPRKKAVAEKGGKKTVGMADTSSAAQLLDMSELPAAKKNQAKKTQNEGQTKIKKARITKPGAAKETAEVKNSARNPRSKRAAEGTERTSKALSKGEKASETNDESLNLDEAVRRRRDWTPIEDTVPRFKCLEQDTASPEVSLVGENFPQTDSPAGQLENLMGDFGYAQQGSLSVGDPKSPQGSNGKGLIKRQKVELIDTTICPAQPPKAKRSTPPKKKSQTITEKATAPFVLAMPQPASSLLQYFPASARLDNIHAVSQDLADTAPATKKRQRKSPVKRATTKKPKKQISDAPILLSPESAIKTATDQELVFGTSSQLAGSESPTFIRDLRKAMEASESTAGPILENPSTSMSVGMLLGSSARSNVTSYVASRNLWSIASRDAGGSLLNPEFVNLADTPKPLKIRTIEDAPLLPKFVFLDAPRTSMEANVERDVAKDTLNPIEKGFLEAAPTTEQRTIDVEPIIYEHVAKLSAKGRFKSRAPVKRAKKNVAPDNSEPPETRFLPEGMPNYQGFTTAELSKTVASYAFKPIKKREVMIALLERCWEDKQRTALQALPPNMKIPRLPNAETPLSEAPEKSSSPEKKEKARKTATVSIRAETNFGRNAFPKKPRGRPRKVSTDGSSPQKRLAITSRKSKEFPIPQRSMTPHPIDDISDSDSIPPTPSPPRRSSSKPTPYLPLSAQKSAKLATANPTTAPPLSSPNILDSITQAITSATPTHDPRNLTWNERILMYEPLIIEDLTRWLNEEGLGKVAKDEEVGTSKVREWCEGRGVCWIWRGGWRGNKARRE